MNKLKVNDHVITNKGNHGKLISFKDNQTAIVKIGKTLVAIELQNLININGGYTFEVEYIDGIKPSKTNVFIKHGTILFDSSYGEVLYKELQNQLRLKLNIYINPLITKITIP